MHGGLLFSTTCPAFHAVQRCHSIPPFILHIYAVTRTMRIVPLYVFFTTPIKGSIFSITSVL